MISKQNEPYSNKLFDSTENEITRYDNPARDRIDNNMDFQQKK